LSPVASGGLSGLSPNTKNPDHKYAAAVSANTSVGPLKASTTPAIAGPANIPTPEMVFSARFDAVNSSGVVASDGKSAASAGPNAVEMMDTSTASTYATSEGPPVAAMTVIPTTSAARDA